MPTTLWRSVVFLAIAVCAAGCNGTTEAPTPAASPSTPSPATSVSLSGRVYDTAAHAVSGATVSIVSGPNAAQTTTTDSAGQYQFTALQPAALTISASAADYVTQTQIVTLAANRTLDFYMRRQPAVITLTGRVTDATTGSPIVGAVAYINGRYRGVTDGSGLFGIVGLLDYGSGNDFTYVAADGYFADYRYIRGKTQQDVQLRRIERIPAGDSKLVTVAPDDTLCVNNVQDSPGIGPDYVCRSLLVTVAQGGAVTIEAVSNSDGTHPPLEVETRGAPQCCSERLGNPTTISVAAGVDITVNVEMLANPTPPRSFVVSTSPPR